MTIINGVYMSKKCYQGGDQHKFEPRYDEQPIKSVGDCSFKHCSVEEARSFFFYKVYLYDICVWCGKKIER